jgi:hypothetical protein
VGSYCAYSSYWPVSHAYETRCISVSESGTVLFSDTIQSIEQDDCQLSKYRLSDNVGGAKQLFEHAAAALGEEHHFALAENCRFNLGSLVINIQVWNSVRPMHLFGL